jgi:hypothetical protein
MNLALKGVKRLRNACHLFILDPLICYKNVTHLFTVQVCAHTPNSRREACPEMHKTSKKAFGLQNSGVLLFVMPYAFFCLTAFIAG